MSNPVSPKGIHYPADLAEKTKDQWDKHSRDVHGNSRCAELPPLNLLTGLLEVAFFASLESEEGRDLNFLLCCNKKGDPIPRLTPAGPEGTEACRVLRFSQSKPFSVKEIRRLAPATSPVLSCILVEWDSDGSGLLITGVVLLGSSWFIAKRGFDFGRFVDQPPHTLLIDVSGRGHLTVSVGVIRLASLSHGTLTLNVGTTQTQMFGMLKLMKGGIDRLSSQAKRRAGQKRAWVKEWIHYTDVIVSILNSIESGGHGGTLIVASPQWMEKRKDRFLKIRNPLSNATVLHDAFVTHLSALYRSGLMRRAAPKDAHQDLELRRSLQQRNSAVSVVAGFSSVDGAVLLSSDLVCHGFGCEIVIGGKVRDFELCLHDGAKKGKREVLNREEHGMRHRSVFRLCAENPHLAAFVCSQDGGVKMIWKNRQQVFMQPILPITFDCDFDP